MGGWWWSMVNKPRNTLHKRNAYTACFNANEVLACGAFGWNGVFAAYGCVIFSIIVARIRCRYCNLNQCWWILITGESEPVKNIAEIWPALQSVPVSLLGKSTWRSWSQNKFGSRYRSKREPRCYWSGRFLRSGRNEELFFGMKLATGSPPVKLVVYRLTFEVMACCPRAWWLVTCVLAKVTYSGCEQAGVHFPW